MLEETFLGVSTQGRTHRSWEEITIAPTMLKVKFCLSTNSLPWLTKGRHLSVLLEGFQGFQNQPNNLSHSPSSRTTILLMKHTGGYQMQLLQADIIFIFKRLTQTNSFYLEMEKLQKCLCYFDGKSILMLKINSNKDDNYILGQNIHQAFYVKC